MLENILPERISNALNGFNYDNVTEIRIRKDKPILVFVENKSYFLGDRGLFNTIGNSIFPTKTEIEDIVFRACKCSVYSNNDKIKKGFITLENGIRIGICGDVIYENGEIKTISNFSSINIRIPKQCKYCAAVLFNELLRDNYIKNTLIIAPPGAGKTTFIRDICYELSESDYRESVCIIDERGEISASGFNIGNFTDVICFANKEDGIEQAIRTLNPAVVVCDEIGNEKDAEIIGKAFNSGVSIITTVHGTSIDEIRKKPYINSLIKEDVFDLYCVLSKKDKIGKIEGIYNKKLSRIG